jgi:hypothetical protein
MKNLAALLVAIPLCAQAPQVVKAQYDWGYATPDGQGKGTLALLLEPGTGRIILELQGLGERLMLLDGNSREGFHLLIPRREVDQRAPSLAALPLPFLPKLGSPEALYQLLTQGQGPGVKVTKKDKDGPVKLRYDGKDEGGKEVTVWLTRTRWELAK